MPAMRVHELAKEFGMSSKELLDHLNRLKIPARNHASTLVEAYVDKIRKDLHDIIEVKQAELEAERAREEAEAAEREAAERAQREAEEAARLAAEAAKRAEEEAARKAEEEARAQEDAARAKEDEERRARETEERNKREAEEALRRETERKAAEERQALAEQAARTEAEEADRYRQMARDAEAAQQAHAPANIITEAAKMVQSDSDRRKKKTKKPTGKREAAVHPHITADEKPHVATNAITIAEGSTVAQFA
ncbi:hypothetical protein EG835_06085, partial [bacterium]|nr:hypothetical protein [bacterium]